MIPEERPSTTQPADPPTRRQRPGRSSAEPRPEPEPGATRLQKVPRQPAATRVQNGPRKPGATGRGLPIPAELRERYDIGRPLGSGGEATVWLAHAADDPDRPVALKVYRPGAAFDVELRRRLDRPEWRRYLPELYAYGTAQLSEDIEVGWEAMEYFPLGTLTDLVAREAPPGGTLPADRLRAIVAEVVDSFDFWETTIQRRQTDVSPGNILVRSDGPRPELVMGDFGGVLSTGASARIAELMAKAAYMSPESLAGLNDPLGPYWSLGAICYELLSGQLMYGQDLTEDTIRVALVFDEPDVAGLPEQWQDLVAGLLTRRLEDRWGAAQVRDWLAGRRVPVRRRANGAARLPVTFASTPYTDPIALAAAMVDASEDAAAWLSDTGAARLGQWLADDLEDYRFDRRILADVAGDLVSAHVAVVAFAATYLPNLPPRYRGAEITVNRLRILAGDPARHPLLVEVVRRGVLPYAARHRCDHPGCVTEADDGCRQLAELGRLVPRAVTIAMNSLATLPGELGDRDAQQSASLDPAGGRVFSPAAEGDVCAEAVLQAIEPEPAKTRQVALRLKRGPDEPWWQLRRRAALSADPGTADGLAALVVVKTLRPFAVAYQRALSQARKAGGERTDSRRWPGAGLRARAVQVGTRLDRRAGQHTWPWFLVTLFAAIEAFGLAPAVRSWGAAEPEINGPIRQGAGWLRSHTPDFVTGAADPLGAWQAALSPQAGRWLGPAVVATIVVACLALARKTTGETGGARTVRVLAALTGRVVMTACLLHLAVRSFAPVVTGLTATAPWIVGIFVVVVSVLVRPLGGAPRPVGAVTAPWPARLLVGGGLLAVVLLLLQQLPLPDPATPAKSTKPAPSRPATPRTTK